MRRPSEPKTAEGPAGRIRAPAGRAAEGSSKVVLARRAGFRPPAGHFLHRAHARVLHLLAALAERLLACLAALGVRDSCAGSRTTSQAQQSSRPGHAILRQGTGAGWMTRWAGTGVDGLAYLDVDHPYAADLDLFGKGSLFERLCTAQTRSRRGSIAAWLVAPSSHPRPFTSGTRRSSSCVPASTSGRISSCLAPTFARALIPWPSHNGERPRALPSSTGLRIAAFLLALLGSAAVIGWAFFETGTLPLIGVLAAEGVFALALAGRDHLQAIDERATTSFSWLTCSIALRASRSTRPCFVGSASPLRLKAMPHRPRSAA